MLMSASRSTNTSSGSTPGNRAGGGSGEAEAGSGPTVECSMSGHYGRGLIAAEDLVQGGALGRRPAGAVGSRHEISRLQADAVIAAGHSRYRLLHERAAQIVDSPAQRLGRGIETHLDPARLQIADRLAERQPESRGVLEILLA